MSKKALILGVSGQDGAYLAKLLVEKGYEVTGSSRDAQMCAFNNLKTLGINDNINKVSVSLKDFRSVLQAIKHIQPDEIYNLAGQTSVGLSFSQPVETFESISLGTLNILESIRMLDVEVKLYNAGSSECFGNTNGAKANEQTPFRPRSPYAVAKADAFWQVANFREAYGLFACSGLLFNHESPLRPDRFVTKKIVKEAVRIKNGKQKKLCLGDTSIQRDWGWAPEYVVAMWLILQKEKADDFVIATGETHSLENFVEIVFERLGLNYHEYLEKDESLRRPTDIETSLADPSKAIAELGWKARYKMEDVAREMVKAEIENKEGSSL